MLSLIFLLFSSQLIYSETPDRRESGEYPWVTGTKWPNSPEEGHEPIYDQARSLPTNEIRGGFTQLLNSFLPSPNQEDGGSCMFMAYTGVAEHFYYREHPNEELSSGGKFDLSERYTMNLSSLGHNSRYVKNWQTDLAFLFRGEAGAVANRDYKYTKGFYKYRNGRAVKTSAEDPAASYGTSYNWIIETDLIPEEKKVTLPTLTRDIIFKDPEGNHWNVAVTPEGIVEEVKSLMQKYQSPVVVTYNHRGYWHTVIVAGFHDNIPTVGCPFIKGHVLYMEKKANGYRASAIEEQDDLERKEALLSKARYYEGLAAKVEKRLEDRGGCQERGVFFVRDSIYTGPRFPLYDYDPERIGDETPYSKKYILREYQWLDTLANHLVLVRKA